METPPAIRPATYEDVPTLLALIHATATEHGVPDAVTATEDGLSKTLDLGDPTVDTSSPESRPPRHAKAVVIVAPEGPIAGMAIYFATYVAWKSKAGICLEDLYVLPAYRRRGYARLLVQAVAKEGSHLDFARMEWLCFKENERALRFYHGLGAKELASCKVLRLDRDGMESLASNSGEPLD